MGNIGNWGDIKFQVSRSKTFTFNDFKYKISARTSKHSLINNGTKLEWLGMDASTITFAIYLNALLGVRPRKEAENLENKMRAGTVAPIVIGGRRVGTGKWMLTGMSEAYDVVLKKGEVLEMKLDLTMTEYSP